MKLGHNFHLMCNRNREGSQATQANRLKSLKLITKDLKEIGYNQIDNAHSLKPKHVNDLVSHWKKNDLSSGTIKNRMAHLRWVAEKTNQPALIAKENAFYGIENREFVGKDKSLDFTDKAINAISDPYVQASALLQKNFGLRREEAMKICPVIADLGNQIFLKGSWCKGGRPRYVEITTPEQRTALDHAKQIAGNGSLIPAHLMYVNQMRTFERQMSGVGLGQSHGARHEYAQQRYLKITGWLCPVKSGPSRKEMTTEQKNIDESARLQISREMGHERIGITGNYLG